MHNQPINAGANQCVICERAIARGAAIRRAGRPYHVRCLVRTLEPPENARRWDRSGRVGSPLGQPPAPERESKCEPFQQNTVQS